MRLSFVIMSGLLAGGFGCSSEKATADGGVITDVEQSRLLDTCLAAAAAPGRCASVVDLLVSAAEQRGCGYPALARALGDGLAGDEEALKQALDC